MHAYFSESLPAGERAALALLAPRFGIAENEAMAMFESDDYAAAVRADEARAAQICITSVPFFVFDKKSTLAGAQSVEVFAEILQKCNQDTASVSDAAWHQCVPAGDLNN